MSAHAERPFDAYRANTHSQHGEDGVVEEILRRLGLSHGDQRWCVEFGAWDGIYLSNTFAFVEKGWRAVYIEGDPARFEDLRRTAARYPSITPIQAFVARAGGERDSLDSILGRTPIPKQFELLSIDIDSYDLDVWESVSAYAPLIVVIEINSSIPPGVIWRHSAKTQGNSFTATLNVAADKGYTLVCHTGNMIFVRNDAVERLGLPRRFLRFPELLFLYDSEWMQASTFGSSGHRSLGDRVPGWLKPPLRWIKRLFT